MKIFQLNVTVADVIRVDKKAASHDLLENLEFEDGSKSYVSPEEKEQLLLDGRIKADKMLEMEKHKAQPKEPETDSDSGYEIPASPQGNRPKPKSCDELDKIQTAKPELKRNSSFPLSDMETSPGDNGRINLPPYIVPLETSLTFPMTKKKKKEKKMKQEESESSSPELLTEPNENVEDFPSKFRNKEDDTDGVKRFFLKSPPKFWGKKRKMKNEEETEDKPSKNRFSWKRKDSETSENEPKRFSLKLPKLSWNQSENPDEKNVESKADVLDGSVELSDVSDNDDHKTEEIQKIEQQKEPELNEELEAPNKEVPGAVEIDKILPISSLPSFPNETKGRNRKSRYTGRIDTNPLKKMFGIKGNRQPREIRTLSLHLQDDEDDKKQPELGRDRRTDPFLLRHGDEEPKPEGEIEDAGASPDEGSDTESADHGSADKSSMSKLTNQNQPKKLMSGLLGSFRKGKKDKVADNETIRSPPSFEISIKEPVEEPTIEVTKPEGIVYAELDMARSQGNVMRRDDEKTEYAEIIYPGTKLTSERAMEELRKSRENLSTSRENLTEVDEAFATVTTPDGKKEAAV